MKISGEMERMTGRSAKEREEKGVRERTHFLPCPLNEENYGSCKEEHPDEIAP